MLYSVERGGGCWGGSALKPVACTDKFNHLIFLGWCPLQLILEKKRHLLIQFRWLLVNVMLCWVVLFPTIPQYNLGFLIQQRIPISFVFFIQLYLTAPPEIKLLCPSSPDLFPHSLRQCWCYWACSHGLALLTWPGSAHCGMLTLSKGFRVFGGVAFSDVPPHHTVLDSQLSSSWKAMTITNCYQLGVTMMICETPTFSFGLQEIYIAKWHVYSFKQTPVLG